MFSNDDLCFENCWVRKDGRIVYVLWLVYWLKEKYVRVVIVYDIIE